MVSEGIPVEVFDARRFSHDWQGAAFDDSGWGNAYLVPAMHIGGFARTQPPTDPYGPLYPRPIAKLGGELKTPATLRVETLAEGIDATIGSPVKRVEAANKLSTATTAQSNALPVTVEVPTNGLVRLVLDMGVIVSGLVEFEVDAPMGTIFDFSYMEEPIKAIPDLVGQHAGTRYVARGENDRFEVFDSNGLRYAYILMHGTQGTVTLKHFGVRELVYPWQASVATMKS